MRTTIKTVKCMTYLSSNFSSIMRGEILLSLLSPAAVAVATAAVVSLHFAAVTLKLCNMKTGK